MPDDRATQISARLAAASLQVTLDDDVAAMDYIDSCDDLVRNARADLAWLLAERAELLRRVEFQTSMAEAARADWASALRRVEAAERAGAVKALLSAGRAVAEDMNLVSYETGLTIEKFMERRAGAIENGADL